MPSTRTIDYAALERATGVRRDDPRSDIYFAGCIYYHMLSGTPPLMEIKNRTQRLNKMRFSNIPPIQQLVGTLPPYLTSALNKSMALEPSRRYQSPGEFLNELEMVSNRLVEEPAAAAGNAAVEPAAQDLPIEEPAPSQHAVMVVEPNVRMQDLFRNGLKKAGFRVLLTSDPERAFERVALEQGAAHCIVLNAQELGEAALTTFNRLGDDLHTQGIPALLLVENAQRDLKKRANTAKHRVVVSLPITMGQLRNALNRLIPLAEGFQASA